MNKPTDYPVESNLPDTDLQVTDITYAELRDRMKKKQPVTDEMISIARKKMETAHSGSSVSDTDTVKFKLSRLADKFKSS